MEFGNIGNLVGRTVRLEDSSGCGVYYQGKLELHLMQGLYRIREPIKIYPDGRKEKQGGWRTVREKDFEEGRLSSLPH